MSYFQDSEFQCRCGKCPVRPPDASLLSRLEELRGAYGKPLYISSGWRCEPYNRSVGGVKDSAHLMGKAVDLLCTSSKDRYNLLYNVFNSIGLFQRVGIGTTFIHVDTDETKDQGVIWLYGTH